MKAKFCEMFTKALLLLATDKSEKGEAGNANQISNCLEYLKGLYK